MSTSETEARRLYTRLFPGAVCPPELVARYEQALPVLARQDERTRLQLVAMLAESQGLHPEVFYPAPRHFLLVMINMSLAMVRYLWRMVRS